MSKVNFESKLRLGCMDIIGYIGQYRAFDAREDSFSKQYTLARIRETMLEMQAALDAHDAQLVEGEETA